MVALLSSVQSGMKRRFENFLLCLKPFPTGVNKYTHAILQPGTVLSSQARPFLFISSMTKIEQQDDQVECNEIESFMLSQGILDYKFFSALTQCPISQGENFFSGPISVGRKMGISELFVGPFLSNKDNSNYY